MFFKMLYYLNICILITIFFLIFNISLLKIPLDLWRSRVFLICYVLPNACKCNYTPVARVIATPRSWWCLLIDNVKFMSECCSSIEQCTGSNGSRRNFPMTFSVSCDCHANNRWQILTY